MSVGSQELERSTLEAKDRESLHQIATAMGGKPGSRAKKADIITMILKLAGVADPASGSSAPDVEDADPQLPLEASAPAPAPAAEDEEAPAPAAPQAPSTNGNGQAVGGDAEDDAPAADAERNGTEGARTDERDRDQSRDGGNRGAQGQPRPDGDEPSSRRRRRRGRDRDRQGQPGAPGAPAPAAAGDDFLGEPVEVLGLLDLRDEGYGFLRVKAYLPSKDDVYVSVKQVRQFGLRKGDELKGAARPASRNEKNPALLRIDEVNGKEPELNKQRARFEELTPRSPEERYRLESAAATEAGDLTGRILDLVTPVGRGQRGLIVSPPGAGKTEILKRVGDALEANHDEVRVFALLIDARPEEVTDLQACLDGEVVASTFDRPADEHLMVAELVVERAKRLVEEGLDVVILVDGLTRLARAYDLSAPPTGRVVGGAVDAAALHPTKRLLGAARNIEEGGSLTVLATALVETGSRADEVVVEELQGALNLELRLDRSLAEHRSFPAVDVVRSVTRHEELLVGDQQGALTRLRRELAIAADTGGLAGALEALLARLVATASNDELLAQLAGD